MASLGKLVGETDDLEWSDDKDAARQARRSLRLVIAGRIFDGRRAELAEFDLVIPAKSRRPLPKEAAE